MRQTPQGRISMQITVVPTPRKFCINRAQYVTSDLPPTVAMLGSL